MTHMVYGGHGGSGVKLEFKNNEDLAMLQLVMTKRFKLGEGFWFDSNGNVFWLHPSIPLTLHYDANEPIEVSMESVFRMNELSRQALGVSIGEGSVSDRMNFIDPDWTPEDAANEA